MRRLVIAVAIVAAGWSGVAGPGVARAGDDQLVANTLAKNLKSSDSLKGFQIKVQYRDGTARLEGWVRNKQQLDEAVAIANRTPQVERVINLLEIKTDAPAASAGSAPQIVPASVSRPQRLPPAPESASRDNAASPSDQPVLHSALRSQRGANQPAEFKPGPANLSPLPPATLPTDAPRVGQRPPQPIAPRSMASAAPATLPMPSNSGSMASPPSSPNANAQPARPVSPKPMPAAVKPMPMNSANVQRPTVQRATPAQQADEGWGRSSPAAPQITQTVPRRPVPMPMSYQQQQVGYPRQYAQAYGQYPQQYGQYPQQYGQGYPQPYQMAAYPQPAPMPMGGMGGAAPMPAPVPTHVPGVGGGPAPAMYDQPYLPNYAWPSYAAYPNYAAVSYPKQYSPTAWPYIGPFYPYPQVPLGWRKVTLEWDDGWWFLDFSDDRRHGCGR